MPTCAIEQQDGVRARGDKAGYLVEMKLHGGCVGVRESQRRACSACWTDSAEEIGVFVALVRRLAWSRSAPGPLPDAAILLADARLVLKPNFDCARRQIGQMGVQSACEVFLKASIVSAFWPGWRGRALICEKPSFFSSVPT